MPLNQFNQHFLQSCSSEDIMATEIRMTSLPYPFYICESFDYHVKVPLRLRGEKKFNKEHYVLDNGDEVYEFPISAKIESVAHYNLDGNVMINNTSYTYQQLANINVVKGDKISFKLGSPSSICIDLVLQCQLVKNE